jgi:hypothetical protein
MAPLTGPNGTRPPVPEIPPNIGSLSDNRHATECRTFLDYVFKYETIKRAELERGWNRARNYDRNRQWLRAMRGGAGGRLWYAWEPIVLNRGDAKFPMPTRNIFSPAIQDEKARLIGVGSKPYVRLDDRDAADAALLAKHALMDRNEKTNWKEQNNLGCYHAAMFGQWIEVSAWDVSRLKTIRGPVLDAVKCSSCSFSLADANVTAQQAGFLRSSKSFPGAIHRIVDDKGNATDQVQECPDCNKALEPYPPPPDVYAKGADAFGRPFGKDRPMGEDITRLISPYSFFPGNQGIGYQTAEEMEEFGIRTPETLNWIKARHEDTEGLIAEPNRELFRHHPVAGAWAPSYGYEGLWDQHALYDQWYLKPTVDFPQGRAIIMAGRKLLYSGVLFIEGTEIPMLQCQVAQWEPREGEIWGKSLAEDLFSVQDNINSGLSQAMDMGQKWTNPKLIMHEGMNIDFNGGNNGQYASDIWTINTRGLPAEVQSKYPYAFGNNANPGTLWQMYDRDRDHVETASGARNAEVGNVSGVELNYSALLFAAQKSAERRKPRTDGIRELKRKIWTHRLRLIAGLYSEERLIHYQNEHSETRTRKIKGLELKGQTEVTLEDEPIVDSAIAERASIQQAIEWGTLDTSKTGGSYGADRRINRAIGVPEELNEDRNIQQDDAQEEWETYLASQEEPVIDKVADDHIIHYGTHNLALESKEARDLKKAIKAQGVPWGTVLRATWEWERLLNELQLMQQAIQTAPAPEMLARQLPPDQVMEIQQKLAKAQQSTAGFPVVLELQIFDVWTRLLSAYSIELSPELKTLVRMKAHTLAHWMLAQGSAQTAGAPPEAANVSPPPAAAGRAPRGGGAPPGGAAGAGATAPGQAA